MSKSERKKMYYPLGGNVFAYKIKNKGNVSICISHFENKSNGLKLNFKNSVTLDIKMLKRLIHLYTVLEKDALKGN